VLLPGGREREALVDPAGDTCRGHFVVVGSHHASPFSSLPITRVVADVNI
jgi:hypothetical protein